MRNLFLSFILCFICAEGAKAQEVRDTVIVNDYWRYEGQWPEGDGVRYSEKHGIYIGRFNEAEPVGMCLCVSPDRSEVYYGNISDGLRHGYGILSRPGQFYYKGNFEDGFYEGSGMLFYPDKTIYNGDFHVGKPTFEQFQTYSFKDRKKFDEQLPKFPEYELTKDQKKFLKTAQKNRNSKKQEEAEQELISPSFMGSDVNLFSRWVNRQLVYPKDARVSRKSGTVMIKFTVLKTGELADPYVMKSSDVISLDMEALRAVCTSPKWEPGTRNGQPVDVTYRFPIIFKI